MREIRSVGEAVRRAATAQGDIRPIEGYAAVFSSPTLIGDWFEESIEPGAFAQALNRDDVRCLFNHSDMYVIGRNTAGTLRLSEDDHGLRYEADPPDATWARDLVVSIDRGDINQSSFAFRATRQEWDESGDVLKRRILEVELFDVSPVTFPAYDDTEVGVRAKALLSEARGAGLIRSLPAPAPAPLFRMRAELDLRARTVSPARR